MDRGGRREEAGRGQNRRTDGRCSELSQGLRTPTERATATAVALANVPRRAAPRRAAPRVKPGEIALDLVQHASKDTQQKRTKKGEPGKDWRGKEETDWSRVEQGEVY